MHSTHFIEERRSTEENCKIANPEDSVDTRHGALEWYDSKKRMQKPNTKERARSTSSYFSNLSSHKCRVILSVHMIKKCKYD